MSISSLFMRGIRFLCRPFVKLDARLERKLIQKERKKYIKSAKQIQRFSYANPRDEFFADISVITHAGGGLQGMAYLNCKEALPFYYDMGNRVFEYDVEMGKDGYVLAHTDEKNPDGHLEGRFTPLSLAECLSFLQTHKDIRIIFDCKFKNIGVFASYITELVRNEQALRRIVIQVFKEQDILEVRKAYDFKLLYVCMYATNYAEAVQTCIKHRIGAVSVSVKALNERPDWYIFEKNDICVFAYTVNALKEYKIYKTQGVTGVFSDFLYESDVEE